MSDASNSQPTINKRIETRNEIIELLKEAFYSGYLNIDEFERRIYKAENEINLEEIEKLIVDLPKEEIGLHGNEVSEYEIVKLNMSNKKLTGNIIRTKKLIIEASMSTIKIDYNEIKTIRGIQEINVQMNMSNLILYVPDDVRIESKVHENMSTYKESRNRNYDSVKAIRTIVINGSAKMSNIKVKRKRHWFISKKV